MLRELQADAGYGGNDCNVGVGHPLGAVKHAQQRLAFCRPDALNLVEHRAQRASFSSTAMGADGEAVGLVSNLFDEKAIRGVRPQHEGVFHPWHKQALGAHLQIVVDTVGVGDTGDARDTGDGCQAFAIFTRRLGAAAGFAAFGLCHIESAGLRHRSEGQGKTRRLPGMGARQRRARGLVADGNAVVAAGGDRGVELSLAAVDDEQIGQIAQLFAPAQPPTDGLVHHGEVVGALDVFDVEPTIAGLGGRAVDEADLAGDGVLALKQRDIETLDHPRWRHQPQALLQGGQAPLAGLGLSQSILHGAGGVSQRDLDELAPPPALRDFELDASAAALTDHLLQCPFAATQSLAQEHFVGDRFYVDVVVKLAQPTRHQLFGGKLCSLEFKALNTLHAAIAHNDAGQHQQ